MWFPIESFRLQIDNVQEASNTSHSAFTTYYCYYNYYYYYYYMYAFLNVYCSSNFSQTLVKIKHIMTSSINLYYDVIHIYS